MDIDVTMKIDRDAMMSKSEKSRTIAKGWVEVENCIKFPVFVRTYIDKETQEEKMFVSMPQRKGVKGYSSIISFENKEAREEIEDVVLKTVLKQAFKSFEKVSILETKITLLPEDTKNRQVKIKGIASIRLEGGIRIQSIKNFTEGNYSIFNVPFEGEELKEVLPDFDTLGINYAVLPDLKVGDNNSQLVIPNTDRNKLEMWFKMWKEKQLRNGEQPGEIYEMDENSYMNTGTLGEEEYIGAADPKFQEANMQFEQNEKEIPGIPAIGKENSEEFIRLSQDNNYKKITINNDTLVENVVLSEREKVLSKQGFFISRIPGTYGEKQMTLILPKSQVFKTDEGKTFIAFIPKNKGSMVASAKGEVKELSFDDVMNAYDPVKRGFRKVEEMMKPEISPDIKPDIKLSPDMAKDIAGKGGPLPKIKP